MHETECPLFENNVGMVCMENNALFVRTQGGMVSMENNTFCVRTIGICLPLGTMPFCDNNRVFYAWETIPFV